MKTIEQVAKLNCPDFFDKYTRSGAALAEFQSKHGYLNEGSEELNLFNKKEADCRKKRATVATTNRAPKAASQRPIGRTSPLVKEEVAVALELPVKRQSQEVKEIVALDNSFESFLQRLDDTSSLVFNKILDGLSAQKLLNLIKEGTGIQKRILNDYLGNHYQIQLQKRPPTTPIPYYDYECMIDGIKFKAVLGPNWPKTEGHLSSHREDYAFKFVFEPIQIHETIFKITLLINLQKTGNWPPSIQIDTVYEDSWNGPYTVPVHIFQSLLRITYITFMMYWKKTIQKEAYYKRVTNRMITDQIYNTGILRFSPIFRRHYSLRLEDTPFPHTNEVLQTMGLDLDLLYEDKPNPLGIMIDKPYHINPPFHAFADSEGRFVIKSLIRFGEGLGDHVAMIEFIYDGTAILIQYNAPTPFREFFQMMKLVNIDENFINNMIYVAVTSIYMNIPTILNDMEVQPNVEILRQLLSNMIVEFKVVPSANPETLMGLMA